MSSSEGFFQGGEEGFKLQLRERFLKEAEMCRVTHPELVARIESLVHSIDGDVLGKIFREYAQKAQIPESEVAIVSPHDFLVVAKPNSFSMMAYLASGQIIINVAHPNFPSVEDISEDGEKFDAEYLNFLHSVFHEQTHATGGQKIAVDGTSISIHVGVHETNIEGMATDTPSFTEYFRGLNEGITDRVADEVLIAYLHRTGRVAPGTGQQLEEFITQYSLSDSLYSKERSMVGGIVSAIAKHVTLPESIVWQAFVRQYYRRESLFDDEVAELFEETLGGDIADWVRNANPKEASEMDEKVSLFLRDHEEVVRAWLDHLNIKA